MSTKAMKFENDMLAIIAELKQHVLQHIEDSETQQAMIGGLNRLWDRAHLESRRLRKALAFLHQRVDNPSEKFTIEDFVKRGHDQSEDSQPEAEDLSS
jgi:ABC-type cobalamin/Fe3+-siderophores transport system ATPase subunit